MLADEREIEMTITSVTVACTVVVVVVVGYVTGFLVGDDEASGAELMRLERREHPKERLKPLRRDLLAYAREI